jgi:hypothetical protein
MSRPQKITFADMDDMGVRELMGRRAARIKKTIIAAFAAANLISTAEAEPNKMLFELQERCGKQAAEAFGSPSAISDKNILTTASYENHYNARLNKCFYLLTVTTSSLERWRLKNVVLIDLHENKEYGTFMGGTVVTSCEVRGIQCRTEQEWQALVKPFMEE